MGGDGDRERPGRAGEAEDSDLDDPPALILEREPPARVWHDSPNTTSVVAWGIRNPGEAEDRHREQAEVQRCICVAVQV